MRGTHYLAVAIGLFVLGITGSAGADSLKLSSKAFTHGSPIPVRYTCDGRDVSPPLAWSGIPDGTRSLALIVSDPDAPGRIWYHWVLYAIPPEISGLPENVDPQQLSAAIRSGLNSWGRTGYGGPCPPIGRHHYFFHLYALDQKLDLPGKVSAVTLRQALKGHIIADAVLMGTYTRSPNDSIPIH